MVFQFMHAPLEDHIEAVMRILRYLKDTSSKGLLFSINNHMCVRLREAASLEKHVLLKKLRDALESLKGHVAGRNKDDVEDAIAMVSIL